MAWIAWRHSRPGDLPRALVWAAAVLAAALLAPLAAHLAAWLPECNFHRWTGVACPSCGATRAILALTRGRVGQAFAWNPLAAFAGAALAASALAAPIVVLAARRAPVPARSIPAAAWWLLAAAIVANWIYLIAAGI